MAERLVKIEDFYHEYAGQHKGDLDDDLLMQVIQQAFYAGALGGVGVVANRISLLEAQQSAAEMINGISDVISGANAELKAANEMLGAQGEMMTETKTIQ